MKSWYGINWPQGRESVKSDYWLPTTDCWDNAGSSIWQRTSGLVQCGGRTGARARAGTLALANNNTTDCLTDWLTLRDWLVFQSANYRRTELTSDWDTLELDKKDSRMGTQESDYITQRIGVFGRYQLRCFLLVQFVGVFAAWQVLVRKIEIHISCVTIQWVRSQLKTGYWLTDIYLFIFH